ncbi:hypothetical protein AAF712_012765 [Marasmius tenuissimus]|uniref:GST N-terminal domain-containing protein n=1 Tax=Marasmius tenuissimus TaxID=585030 RepID=A0ABR2ZGH2_9AGAR
MITVYDAGPSTNDEFNSVGLSPFVRAVVFVLRFKNLPYKLAYHHPPCAQYTIPVIHDAKTGEWISDSSEIADYLDRTYPDTPRVIPEGTKILQRIFQADATTRMSEVYSNVIRSEVLQFFPKEVVEKFLGGVPRTAPEPEKVKAAFVATKEAFDKLNVSLNGGKPLRGFLMGGGTPTLADMTVVGLVYSLRVIFGEDSEEWRDVRSWANGWVGWEFDEVLKVLD